MQKIYYFIFFKLFGWRMLGEPPQGLDKYLLVVAPHTSNWDFVYGWLAIKALGLDIKIFVKDVFFVWPIKYVCNWLGLLPVNRRVSSNFVDSIAEQFATRDKLHALITPEGTRAYVDRLKSGYYYLARKSGVPIVVAGPNFVKKTFTFLQPRSPLDTFDADQQQIIDFSKKQIGRRPDNSFR